MRSKKRSSLQKPVRNQAWIHSSTMYMWRRYSMARITMREAISQAMWEEMERDPNIFILGEEVGVWGGSYAVTKGFYDHFGGERVRDTPIAEAAIIGAA